MRMTSSARISPISSTMVRKPPVCRRRSVALNAWLSSDFGLFFLRRLSGKCSGREKLPLFRNYFLCIVILSLFKNRLTSARR